MNILGSSLALALVAGTCIATIAPEAEAQVSIDIGPAPICPYGYYDYAPYYCAPYGYYGPAWFTGGIFIGAGPWFRGPSHFHGHVNNHYDRRYGFRGPFPQRGERPDPARRLDRMDGFRGNEMRSGIGGRSEGGGRLDEGGRPGEGGGHMGEGGHMGGGHPGGGHSGGGHSGGGGRR